MTLAETLRRIRARYPRAALLENEPLSRWTSFRIGGPSDALFMPRDADELAYALSTARDLGVPSTIIGNGTNLLVRDGGIRGLTIRVADHRGGTIALGAPLTHIAIDGERMTAGAGALLSAAARAAANVGLSGMEAISGIPGAVGGAAWMNAGAYDGEIARVVASVGALSKDYEPVEFSGERLAFRYRGSGMMDEGAVIIRVDFILRPDDPRLIAERMADYTKRRKSKQPLSDASAGSFFKRPEGHFAGTLIESAGLKGFAVGGAMVSPMHAGFIVNKGGATARDVLALKDEIIRRVRDVSGIELEPETRVIGED
ncbi:MAG: UDP-N-acetylmuramate dehydrogenase [Oscillospiraceae bacterium]|jgi:UDP-N-acetylmuramate dehydrogenase|nr:UDP-N-acetylmuramate dehydrogenase [Oscillospiraceae bacterium]